MQYSKLFPIWYLITYFFSKLFCISRYIISPILLIQLNKFWNYSKMAAFTRVYYWLAVCKRPRLASTFDRMMNYFSWLQRSPTYHNSILVCYEIIGFRPLSLKITLTCNISNHFFSFAIIKVNDPIRTTFQLLKFCINWLFLITMLTANFFLLDFIFCLK